MREIDLFKKILLERNSFLLIGHEKPDGDAIGALLALESLLKYFKKDSVLVCKTKVPTIFQFLPRFEKIESDFLIGDYDALILLDNGELKRTGFSQRINLAAKKRIPIINIDHHPQNDIWKIAQINFANANFSSTCQILYQIFEKLNVPLERDSATALLTGIYYDTGGFQHKNTSEKVFLIASQLLSCGANLKQISRSLYLSRSVAMLKLWGIALERMRKIEGAGLVISIITNEDILKCEASEDEVSGLVNLISSASEASVSLLLYETSDGKIKGSLRSDSDGFDVSKLASYFGWGGHKRASGFVVEGKLEQNGNIWQII